VGIKLNELVRKMEHGTNFEQFDFVEWSLSFVQLQYNLAGNIATWRITESKGVITPFENFSFLI